MRRLDWQVLLLLAVVPGVLGSVVSYLQILNAVTPFIPHPIMSAPLLLCALGLWFAGLAVRRLKQNKPTRMTPFGAYRTVLFAQSGAYTGAIFAGYFLGQVLLSFIRLESLVMQHLLWGAGIGALAAAILVIISLVVEHWCTIDDDPDKDKTDKFKSDNPEGGAVSARVSPSTKRF